MVLRVRRLQGRFRVSGLVWVCFWAGFCFGELVSRFGWCVANRYEPFSAVWEQNEERQAGQPNRPNRKPQDQNTRSDVGNIAQRVRPIRLSPGFRGPRYSLFEAFAVLFLRWSPSLQSKTLARVGWVGNSIF